MYFKEKKAELLANAEARIDQIKKLQELGLVCKDGEFVPSVHYPPITQYDQCLQEDVYRGFTMPSDGMMDIYVHFPFCQNHCTFCHYPGLLGDRPEEKKKYLDHLKREMDLFLEQMQIDKIRPRSILLGGGTPTYMSPEMLNYFLDFLCERVDKSALKQFNVDLDPVTMLGAQGEERLNIMRDHGINRLTIGCQSLNDKILKLMNRHHNAEQAIEAVYRSHAFGFQNNIEFIYGYLGQDLENWAETIEKAATLPVEEIQMYRLKVLAYGDYQGAIINARKTGSKLHIPDFYDTMRMKQVAIDLLRMYGYTENLRRVYTKEKKHISHYAYNQCCNLFDQVGFGLTAFSSFRDRFVLNTQNFDEYYSKIDAGKLPLNRGYLRTKESQLRWSMVLPLKNQNIRKMKFEKMNGIPFDEVFKDKIENLIKYGLLEDTGRTIELTDLGKFVADEVAEQFNENKYLPFPREHYADGILNPYNYNATEDAHPSLVKGE